MPRDIGRVQDPQCPHWLEAGSHRRIGGQRWRGGAAQIAVVARVGRRERAVAWCLLGRCRGFALTDDRNGSTAEPAAERGNGSPQHGMQGGGDPPKPPRMLASALWPI